MPTWLVEGNPIVYFLLAFALIIATAMWWRSRKRAFAIAAGVIAVLIFGYYLLDRAVETDGEKMVRKVNQVAAAVTARNVNAAMANVSESFDRHGSNKKQFRDYCERHLSRGDVSSVKVWNVEVEDLSRPTRTGTVKFNFKAQGGWGESPPNWFGRVVFTLDPDDQWRVKSFDVYDSLNNSNSPIAIPEWGGR